ncbi:hypothetical protein Acr_13g0015050 [Actinidia rufa]|uniref:RING-type domain-containing protein n=1 Tax=Actinidia rufa TaxID=165716 RepID=A0A7J0FN19_9ERIC|nr:hypothetical protein Acr_13g0015050 [Actinidia rufa]
MAVLVHSLLFLLRLARTHLITFLRNFPVFEWPFRAMKEFKGRKILKILPPVVKFKTHEGNLSPCTGCAICLEDFKDGELCQVLPLCNHAFHSSCIRPWLINNQSCPNCRTPINGPS